MTGMGLKILTFFSLTGVGYAARRVKVIGQDSVRDVIRFNMDVCIPALTFTTAATRLTPQLAALEKGFAGPLLGLPLAALLTIAAGWLLGHVTTGLAGVHGHRAKTYVYIITFANAAFLPYPLSYAMHGRDGVLYVALYTVAYTPLFWTLGTWMLSGKVDWRFFLHPNLFALAAGAAFGMTGTTLPAWLMEVLELLGSTAIPLALVYAGAILVEHPLLHLGDARPLAVVAGIKLVVLPALALFIVRRFAVPDPIGSQAVLQASMPCMAQAGLYASRFGGEPGLAGRASFLTTTLCLFTVPLFMGQIG